MTRVLFDQGPPRNRQAGGLNPDRWDKSNLGQKKVLFPPPDLFGGRAPYGEFRICDISPDVLPASIGDRPGQWILSISGRYVFPDDLPIAGTYGAVTAEVRFTSGSASHVIKVDAWNTRLQIPSDQVSVDVYWEQLGPDVPEISPIQTFPVEVCANLVRATSFMGALPPLKSYWVLGAPIESREVTIPIPPFAVAWNFLPIKPVETGELPLEYAAVIHGSDDEVLPEVVASMARMNQFRALPPAAKTLFLRFPEYPIQFPGRVQFQINA